MKIDRRQFIAGVGAASITTSTKPAFGKRGRPVGALNSSEDLALLYFRPAEHWTEALPHGNGRIGAMVFGGVENERIQLNEDTLWAGGPHDYVNAEAHQYLTRMREYIFAEKVTEAEELSGKLLGDPAELQAFQPLCDLVLKFANHGSQTGYSRQLNLTDATSRISYRQAGTQFTREVFTSYPDQVLVVRLSADRIRMQNLLVSLTSLHPSTTVKPDEDGGLLLSGQMASTFPPEGSYIASWSGPGLRFAARLAVRLEGGTLNAEDGGLRVSGANAVTLILSAATSFVNYKDISGDPVAKTQDRLRALASLSFKALRSRHVQDYRKLFDRVSLNLGDSSRKRVPTDQRIRDFMTSPDPSFSALLYQFSRYMLISSSRNGGQPANLQGKWNQEQWPNWGGKWTANINVQMNYWLAESGNIAECTEPLFDLIDDLRVTGGQVARQLYGCRGFVFHHNADLWRAATPTDGSWGLWPVGGAWLTRHLWEHYEYSGDEAFLRTRCYPAMRDAATFFLDFLIEVPVGLPFAGCLVTNPSSSPENAFILPDGTKGRLTYAPTMDLEIIGELFDNCVRAAIILGIDDEFIVAVRQARQRMPPLQINKAGRLQEWIKDYEETEPEHRHLSPLYAVYPGNAITWKHTPDLAEAARSTLVRRGLDVGRGSCFKAWRMAEWARLGDGNKAYKLLEALVTTATSPDLLNDSYLQVDGHLGAGAAIAEMLVQSHTGVVVLLPALPDKWSRGRVRGLRVRGGFTLDMSWENGSLSEATIRTSAPATVTIGYRDHLRTLAASSNSSSRLDGRLENANTAGK